MQRRLIGANAAAFDRERQQQARIAEYFVIDGVPDSIVESIEIQGPAANRNRDTDFPNFIAFAANRKETESLLKRELQKRPGNRRCLWMLVVPAVGPTQNREMWNVDRSAETRRRCVFSQRSAEALPTQAVIQGEPLHYSERVFRKKRCHVCPQLFRLC